MRDLSAVHQLILTIEDNYDDNNLLDLKELWAKNKRHFRHQARKICRLHDQMVQETNDFSAKLSINNSISKVSSSSAKDRSDQKRYTDICYDAESLLGNLTDDLKVKSLARSGWMTILNVKTASGKMLSILDSSVIITKQDIQNTRLNRSASEYNNSKKLFVATWCSIASKPKRAMAKYNKDVANNGP